MTGWIGPLIGAVGGLLAARENNSAAQDIANAQAEGSDEMARVALATYLQNRQDMQPYSQAGGNALNAINALLRMPQVQANSDESIADYLANYEGGGGGGEPVNPGAPSTPDPVTQPDLINPEETPTLFGGPSGIAQITEDNQGYWGEGHNPSLYSAISNETVDDPSWWARGGPNISSAINAKAMDDTADFFGLPQPTKILANLLGDDGADRARWGYAKDNQDMADPKIDYSALAAKYPKVVEKLRNNKYRGGMDAALGTRNPTDEQLISLWWHQIGPENNDPRTSKPPPMIGGEGGEAPPASSTPPASSGDVAPTQRRPRQQSMDQADEYDAIDDFRNFDYAGLYNQIRQSGDAPETTVTNALAGVGNPSTTQSVKTPRKALVSRLASRTGDDLEIRDPRATGPDVVDLGGGMYAPGAGETTETANALMEALKNAPSNDMGLTFEERRGGIIDPANIPDRPNAITTAPPEPVSIPELEPETAPVITENMQPGVASDEIFEALPDGQFTQFSYDDAFDAFKDSAVYETMVPGRDFAEQALIGNKAVGGKLYSGATAEAIADNWRVHEAGALDNYMGKLGGVAGYGFPATQSNMSSNNALADALSASAMNDSNALARYYANRTSPLSAAIGGAAQGWVS